MTNELPASETLLYGRKLNAEEWQEEILCTLPAHFERVKQLAAVDGFGHFRVATIDLTQRPNFAATIRRRT